MLHARITCAFLLLFSSAVSAVVNEHICLVRGEAINAMAGAFRGHFCSEKTFEDAAHFIKKDLSPQVHQKILGLQAEAEMLRMQIEHIEARVPGITKESEAIRCLYTQLDLIEKQLDDLIYGGHVIHWKTLFAAGIGAATGVVVYKKTPQKRWRNAVVSGLLTALLIEYMLRGRRSLGIGNAAAGVQWVFRVIGKWVGAVFGRVGFVDKAMAALERALRGVGKKLDKVFQNAPGTVGIGLFAIVLPIAVYMLCSSRIGEKKV